MKDKYKKILIIDVLLQNKLEHSKNSNELKNVIMENESLINNNIILSKDFIDSSFLIEFENMDMNITDNVIINFISTNKDYKSFNIIKHYLFEIISYQQIETDEVEIFKNKISILSDNKYLMLSDDEKKEFKNLLIKYSALCFTFRHKLELICKCCIFVEILIDNLSLTTTANELQSKLKHNTKTHDFNCLLNKIDLTQNELNDANDFKNYWNSIEPSADYFRYLLNKDFEFSEDSSKISINLKNLLNNISKYNEIFYEILNKRIKKYNEQLEANLKEINCN